MKKSSFLLCITVCFHLLCMPILSADYADVAEIRLFTSIIDSEEALDLTDFNLSEFYTYFPRPQSDTPMLTLNGAGTAVIIAVWSDPDMSEESRYLRVVLDNNSDGIFDPMDWEDPRHPWNRPDNGTPDNPGDDPVTWEYTYPPEYPVEDLRGTVLKMQWDEGCECVQGFPEDTFEWDWYEHPFDYTEESLIEMQEPFVVLWNGREEDGRLMADGQYQIQVSVDADDDGVYSRNEPSEQMMVELKTASISGRVEDDEGNPVSGARIEIRSLDTWAETLAEADESGRFQASGLAPGRSYRLKAGGPATLPEEIEEIFISENEFEKDVGVIVLETASVITGTMKLDRNGNGITDEDADQFEPFENQWGWTARELEVHMEVWNMEGTGSGGTIFHIKSGESSGSFEISIPKDKRGTFRINASADGYAAEPAQVLVDKTGGDAGVIVLTKAARIMGRVNLPVPVTQYLDIEVHAVNLADSTKRYWGWGDINPFFIPGFCSDETIQDWEDCEDADQIWTDEQWLDDPKDTDTGEFRFDGIPEGTYRIGIRILGFSDTVLDKVEIRSGEDKDLGEIMIDRGRVISGTLTLQGDTGIGNTGEEDQADSTIEIWVEAWSPETDAESGTIVTVNRGVNQSAVYEIGGLSAGRYELFAWVGEDYDFTDENGNQPVFVEIKDRDQTGINLIVKPNEGIATGLLSASPNLGISIDMNNVAVFAMIPGEWGQKKIATVHNGGIDPETGRYTLSSLGTNDYVIRAAVFDNPVGDISDDRELTPMPGIEIITQRIFVENSAEEPAVLDIEFNRGFFVSGTVSLSRDDPPFHDFGDGAGGPANGKMDIVDNEYNEQIVFSEDIHGQHVLAIPADLALMGGDVETSAALMGRIDDDGTFRIDGMRPGAYMIRPPFTSHRIEKLSGSGSPESFAEKERVHHWMSRVEKVVISDHDITGHDFVFENGHSVSGTLTLPEVQTGSDNGPEAENWVGHLSLLTADNQFTGYEKELFINDFNNTVQYQYSFSHLPSGEYMLYFWTDRYVSASMDISLGDQDVQAESMNINTGIELTGRLVDAETGNGVTNEDGVMVICEAVPYVEGSYRETDNSPWSMSYIEDGSDLQKKQVQDAQTVRTNSTPGQFHLTSVPAGYTYVISVISEHGRRTGGAKNYMNRVIAGIEVPEGTEGEFDVGDIELQEGITITGRLTDPEGRAVPGVDVLAVPTDDHDGWNEASGRSDRNGYYVIYGIDPGVTYYDLVAAERPWMFDDWGRVVEWGEQRRYNIQPNVTDEATERTKGADFVLKRATARLRGTITIPQSASFSLPFQDEDFEDYPAAYILLQQKGVVHEDMLEGIEGLTEPKPEEIKIADYEISHIAAGTYKVIFMNYGLARAEIDNVTFKENEEKVINMAWDDDFYKISGTMLMEDGTAPHSNEIGGVVCMNTKERTVIFGRVTQETDGTLSSYEVPGLAGSDTYQLIFYSQSEINGIPEVYAVGNPFKTGYGNMTYNAVIALDPEPVLILRVFQDATDENLIRLGIFSTAYLSDNRMEIVTGSQPTESTGTGQIYLKTGNGALQDLTFSQDRRSILMSYRKGAGDSLIEIIACVHYAETGITKLETLSFNADALMLNSQRVSPFITDQVTLGNGDDTRIYIPSGALETENNRNLTVAIEKTDGAASSLSAGAGVQTLALTTGSLPSLPEGVTLAGDIYEITARETGTGSPPAYKTPMTVQIAYDPEKVSATEHLHIYHLKDGAWKQETENRTLDTDNAVISAEVTELSTFVAGYGELKTEEDSDQTNQNGQSDQSGSADTGEGGSGECFIRSSADRHGDIIEFLKDLWK